MTLLRLAVEGEVCASAPDIEIEAERFLFVEARVIARFQTFVVVGRERGVLRGQKSFASYDLPARILHACKLQVACKLQGGPLRPGPRTRLSPAFSAADTMLLFEGF